MGNMTEHTPGPWLIYDADDDCRIRIKGQMPPHGGAHVAEVVLEANACLIAAAPMMLTALQELEEFLDNQADVDDGRPNDAMRHLIEVRAAIAKATSVGA